MDKIDSIDGLDFLMDNFFKDDIILDELFKYIYFINKDLVNEQASQILVDIKNSIPIPVRYSQKDGAYFKNNSTRKSSPRFKNRKDAYKSLSTEKYFSSEKGRGDIRVCIDSDGNKSIKDFISLRTNHSFKSGKSTIINCMISHIWGNTNDPLFFSLLWNIVITPLPLSFILDKDALKTYKIIDNQKHRDFILEFKELIKAISILLFNPNEIMDEILIENSKDFPKDKNMKKAKELIDGGKIKFLPYHTSKSDINDIQISN